MHGHAQGAAGEARRLNTCTDSLLGLHCVCALVIKFYRTYDTARQRQMQQQPQQQLQPQLLLATTSITANYTLLPG